MSQLPKAPNTSSPVVLDGATWNYLVDLVNKSVNFAVSSPLNMTESPAGRVLSISLSATVLPCLVKKNGGGGAPTYDIYGITDTGYSRKLNGSGVVTPANYRDSAITYDAPTEDGTANQAEYAPLAAGAFYLFVPGEGPEGVDCSGAAPSVLEEDTDSRMMNWMSV